MLLKKHKIFTLLLTGLLLLAPHLDAFSFGFFAHRKINRMAVFTLPPEMVGFFKHHIEYITERSIDPDRRAHAVVGEAQRHYIDIDHFGPDPFEAMPRRWNDAVEKYTEDTLQLYGVLPWHVGTMMHRLTRAFKEEDVDRILYNATHIGHYISDLCTPLHTTKYYNGRTPEQRGIHALWESRLVELYADSYNYFVGRAEYIESPLDRAWELVKESHLKVDTIYMVFDSLMVHMNPDVVFAHEMRGQSTMRTYSRTFSEAMHQSMNGMVERQMQRAVKSVGDFWYTAWVNAGQPDLYKLEKRAISASHRRQLEREEKQYSGIESYQERPNPR
ncbi:MAG: S1/P1 Nuclease [Bacteroidetes bacterium]|nr:MAG: S1/P1 Nuclease [Bacteroidota bacterium]